jgi:predicted nucleic acid-binding protein
VIYWDTSCVIKLYVTESDSQVWQDLLAGADEGPLSSALLSAELGFALVNKEARGELRAGGARKIQEQFARDVQKGRFRLVPVGSDVLERAVQMAADCLRSSRPIPLRTLDGLHLATASLMRCSTIATADELMRLAAKHIGLRLLKA